MEITRENKNARAQQVIIKTQKRLSSSSIQIQRTDNKNKYQVRIRNLASGIRNPDPKAQICVTHNFTNHNFLFRHIGDL